MPRPPNCFCELIIYLLSSVPLYSGTFTQFYIPFSFTVDSSASNSSKSESRAGYHVAKDSPQKEAAQQVFLNNIFLNTLTANHKIACRFPVLLPYA